MYCRAQVITEDSEALSEAKNALDADEALASADEQALAADEEDVAQPQLDVHRTSGGRQGLSRGMSVYTLNDNPVPLFYGTSPCTAPSTSG